MYETAKMQTTPAKYIMDIPLVNVLVDMIVAALALTPVWLLNRHKMISPFKRGFFCDDDSIRFPFKNSTVPDEYLYPYCVVLPVLTITVLELACAWRPGREGYRRRQVLVGRWALPEWGYRWLRTLLLFAYGFGMHEVSVNVVKWTVGRLRPHFIAVCKPDVLCNATGMAAHAYITDYRCTAPMSTALFQSRLSFPSGHSAASFFAAVFVVAYMERRIHWPERAVVLKTLYEMMMLLSAAFISLTRIQDYKHHPTDVLVGSLFGGVLAVFWVIQVMRVGPGDDAAPPRSALYVFPGDGSPEKP